MTSKTQPKKTEPIIQEQNRKVCFLMGAFYPAVNGAITQIKLLSQSLVSSGIRVSVLTARINSGQFYYEKTNGIEILRVKPNVGLKRIGKYLRIVPFIFALLKERHRYDLIIVSDFKILGLVGVLVAKLLQRRILLRASSCGEMDGTWALIFDAAPSLIKRLSIKTLLPCRNRVLQKADGFLANCSPIQQELLRCGIPRERIFLFHSGVDIDLFKPIDSSEKQILRKRLNLPNRNIFVYTGRLARGKGLHFLINIWEKIVRNHKNTLLLLVGSGQGYSMDCETELHQFVREKNLQNFVTFVGNVANVHEFLKASNYFVFPTEYEALSNSLLEAMSCGLPSIATAVGGNLDIIHHNVNGLLIESKNNSQLYKTIEMLLDDNKLAKRLSKQARMTIVNKFDIKKTAAHFIDLLNHLYT